MKGVYVKFSTMFEWLDEIARIHSTEIELGLDRVKAVARRMDVLAFVEPIIIVGGTNGKGSTVAGLDAIYRASGYKVGIFTSPIVFRHNEQVRIQGQETSDEEFCRAFAAVDEARQDISLTPFEFHTLAALWIFKQHSLDLIILEVGLGGRLDAVNILDADAAVITSIGIDHVEWLGNTREAIGFEKAGIMRARQPVICGDPHPPASVIKLATELKATLYCQDEDFYYQRQGDSWSWTWDKLHYEHLPMNALALQNMSSVLMTITAMQNKLPVSLDAITAGLKNVTLFGRIQIISGPITEIYDVSHNPDSVALLTQRLKEMALTGNIHAVFSMLADKDSLKSINIIKHLISNWYIAPLETKRSMSLEKLTQVFTQLNIKNVKDFSSIQTAYRAALSDAKMGDTVLIFGSFHTVADVWKERSIK